jgi:hypothetical protein
MVVDGVALKVALPFAVQLKSFVVVNRTWADARCIGNKIAHKTQRLMTIRMFIDSLLRFLEVICPVGLAGNKNSVAELAMA